MTLLLYCRATMSRSERRKRMSDQEALKLSLAETTDDCFGSASDYEKRECDEMPLSGERLQIFMIMKTTLKLTIMTNTSPKLVLITMLNLLILIMPIDMK